METLKGGYYTMKDLPVAEHAFVIEGADHTKFPCYGGVTGTGLQYPAKLYTAWIVGSKEIGRSVPADLRLACFIASGSVQWRPVFDRKTGGRYLFGDCSGIVYAVSGVCHQMANRILYATNGPKAPDDRDRAVVWPPSLTASYWVYGFFGKCFQRLPFTCPLGFWEDVVKPGFPGLVAAEGETAGPSEGMPDAAIAYMRNSVRTQLESGHTREVRAPWVADMVSRALGEALPEAQLEALLEEDQGFFARKRDLDSLLLRGEIAKAVYAQAVNDAWNEMTAQVAGVLGADQYAKLFGRQPGERIELVEEDLMLEPAAYRELGVL
jgi:hypothetical protein